MESDSERKIRELREAIEDHVSESGGDSGRPDKTRAVLDAKIDAIAKALARADIAPEDIADGCAIVDGIDGKRRVVRATWPGIP